MNIHSVDMPKRGLECIKSPTYCGQPPVPAIEVTDIMLDLLDLQPMDILMEIGTGTGSQTAVWEKFCLEVHSVELKQEYKVREPLGAHVYLSYGDGAKGIPDAAPFDKIVATCGVPDIPQAWVEQLKEGGRIVAPVGLPDGQKLTLFKKVDGFLKPERVAAYTRFVMMEN